MFIPTNRPNCRYLSLAYLYILFCTKHARSLPLHVPIDVHDQIQVPPSPAPMIDIWKRTVALAISNTPQTSQSSSNVVNAMRSGPLAAVFRATLSTSSSNPCITTDPHKKCEIALDGFGTFGEVHYIFNNSENNLLGRSTQVLISCRCLSADCRQAILIRPINVLKRNQDGKVSPSGKRACLYEAVGGKFSDCHSEVFRVSYRDREFGHKKRIGNENGKNFEYSVADDHHGDFWTARGNRRDDKMECLDTDIEKLPSVNVSNISENDIAFNEIDHSKLSPCTPRAGVQYFLGDEEDEDEICEEIFDRASAAATHIASQQDCFGVGKREISFMEPRSATLITDTELALTCTSAVLGILWLFSVLWKQHRRVKTATRLIVLAVFVQIGLSYVLEALPLHTALNNEIRGRDWRSLIAFADATAAQAVEETKVIRILILTIVLGEAQYMSTRVGLVAGLTGFFDFVAVTLGILILICMIRSGTRNQEGNRVTRSSRSVDSITTDNYVSSDEGSVAREGSFIMRKLRSFSTWGSSNQSSS